MLEVPDAWTTANDVAVGDSVRIEYPENATVTPTPRAGGRGDVDTGRR